jgi:6-phosphogluconate dehydrogenase
MIDDFFKRKVNHFLQIFAGRDFCHLDFTANALAKDPVLAGFAGRIFDSGDGWWTSKAAIEEGVLVPMQTTVPHERFSSRGDADFPEKLLSAMRCTFGGHLEKATTVKAIR